MGYLLVHQLDRLQQFQLKTLHVGTAFRLTLRSPTHFAFAFYRVLE